MNVTIIADASYCDQTTACGWGYSIISDRGRYTGGGGNSFVIGTSTEAEIFALISALVDAYDRNLIQRGDYLIIQSDCQGAIDLLLGIASKKDRHTDYSKELGERFRKIIDGLQLHRWDIRHVPGHTKGITPRTYVNNRCDAIAKKHMRRVRNATTQALKTA